MLEYNTHKDRTKEWILAHLDGKWYSVNKIAHEVKASPTMVRNTIHELWAADLIDVEQMGFARQSRWRFYPNGD